MSKLVGCVLILSGVAVAGLTLPFPLAGDHSEAGIENATVRADVMVLRPPASSTPTAIEQPASPAPPPAEEPQRRPIAAFQTVTVPNDPVSLSRALQTELRRVGCYDGEVHGIWSQPSKRAMKVFMERVNASLPIEKPDHVLLSLVQGQAGKVCGSACPAGQVATAAGGCSPAAIVAQAARRMAGSKRVAAGAPQEPGHGVGTVSMLKPSSATMPVVPADKPGAEHRPFPTDAPRMALAGPMPEAAPDAHPAPSAAELERAARQRASARARAERERRHHYAQTERRPSTWVRDLFRKLDGGV